MSRLTAIFLAVALLGWADQQYPPVGRGDYSGTTTLTESVATDVFTIHLEQGQYMAGTIFWTLACLDATDQAILIHQTAYACYNEGGTEACTANDDSNYLFAEHLSSASQFSAANTSFSYGTDEVTFRMTATCGLTQTTLETAWKLEQDWETKGTVTIP